MTERRKKWEDWAVYVIKTIDDINEKSDRNADDHSKIIKSIADLDKRVSVDIEGLRTEMRLRAGFMGLLGGAIPAVIALIFMYVKNG